MSFDDGELRRRLEAVAAQVSPPRLTADRLIRRVRRRRARTITAASGSVAVLAAAAVAVPLALSGPGQRGTGPPGPAPAGRTGARSGAAPGTLLLTCGSANWGRLPAQWREESLRAGALWFVYGRQQHYARPAGFSGPGRARPGRARAGDVMIVEVASGSRVVMKPAAGSRSYFRFLDGFGPDTGHALPRGDTGFTFVACPRGSTGPNGPVTDFYLGYFLRAGRHAPVQVWTSPSPRPARIILTRPY